MKPTIIIPYYDNEKALKHQIPYFEMYGKYDINVILIDDCSPIPAKVGLPNVSVLRILQDIPWNNPAARNLGMFQTETTWNILTDIDHWFREMAIQQIARYSMEDCYSNEIYTFLRKEGYKRIKAHKNTFLISIDVFDRIGGYDQDMCGNYGYDDSLFFKYAKHIGIDTTKLLIEIEVNQSYSKGNKSLTLANRNKFGIKSNQIANNIYPIYRKPWHEFNFDWEIVE